LLASQDIIRVIKSRRARWEDHIARIEELRNSYKILIGKPGRHRPLERITLRGEDTIL